MAFPKVMPLGESEIIQQRLGIAILGLGTFSKERIIPAVHQSSYCGLAAVICGDDHDKKQVAARHNINEAQVFYYDEMEAICRDDSIGLVYIAVPNALHRKYALKVAAAGKHILCEMPLAPSVKECGEIVAATRKYKVRLYNSYHLQFSPCHQEMKRLGTTGVMGKVKQIKAGYSNRLNVDNGDWKLKKEMTGGGSLLDLGICLVQACRHITGEEPVYVKVHAEDKRPDVFSEVEDTVHWEMGFPSGAVADCTCSYSDEQNFIEVTAEQGTFSLNPAFGAKEIRGKVNKDEMKFPEVMPEEELLDHVAYSIIYNEPSPVNGAEGLKDMRVIAAIYRSIDSGKEERLL
ncbi:MAG TPA: Gfo/Idh/MocA family oxidoreductase [Chitinophaga sp.]